MVFDFDNHNKGAEEKDFANTDDTWIEEVEAYERYLLIKWNRTFDRAFSFRKRCTYMDIL